MARNNKRTTANLGADTPEVSAAPVAQQSNDQSFSWTNPTEFVDLPSEGLRYPQGHPLYNQTSVEIRHMTAKEEDILTSEPLIRKGIVLDRLIDSVLVDKSIRSESLLIGDKNAILIAARVTGYGEEYDVAIDCPNCGTKCKETYLIPEITRTTEASEDIPWVEHNTFKVTLPKTKIEAVCRLMTGKDEELNRQRKKNIKKAGLGLGMGELTSQMLSFIESLNGNTDKAFIRSFVQNMPAYDSRYLRKIYGSAVPNVELVTDFECSNCDHSTEMEVPLTAGFFWPDARV